MNKKSYFGLMLENDCFLSLNKNFYEETHAEKFSYPELIYFNEKLAQFLGFDLNSFSKAELAFYFSGQKLLPGSRPIALAYAGHQFGHFSPQLGDGRALLLGEKKATDGCLYDVQLKGSGRTVFSRNGDGLSQIGPVLRECIVSESMFHLNVPTTRTLAAVKTGDLVQREEPLPGAVLTRVAHSHIRIGTFEYFAARRDLKNLNLLLDFVLKRHNPKLLEHQDKVYDFLFSVMKRQADLVSSWLALGFIHGVMNTDNTSICGETLDYGPCAFLDEYHEDKKFSFIDQYGRYSYKNQKPILYENLCRLANALIPLAQDKPECVIDRMKELLNEFETVFDAFYQKKMQAKLGLRGNTENGKILVAELLDIMQKNKLDFTWAFRNLAKEIGVKTNLDFYGSEFLPWKTKWENELKSQKVDRDNLKEQIEQTNPVFIPRNHTIEQIIQDSYENKYEQFNAMMAALERPFEEQLEFKSFYKIPLEQERVVRTFCGT